MPNNRALRLFINLRKSLNFRKSMKVAFRIVPSDINCRFKNQARLKSLQNKQSDNRGGHT